ncbi:MAG TPA: MotA/TolQ/ExbB proton channel family protein [Sedimentisphaerales bacterium]|nr:MotA/TolQ/ExbB proton channel family protein [Sedimentisphaerales bacterium]
MDIATIIGVLCGFFVIGWAIISSGGWQVFVDTPSLLITFGGMLCSTMIHFSLPQFLGIFSVVRKTIITRLIPAQEIIKQIVNYAVINRREGALALEPEMKKTKEAFLAKALGMIVDGQNEENIRDVLYMEIQYLRERHATGKKILEYMGASAPAMGMIGTLIGLVQMLRTMDDPSRIGGAMAVALITTFYGALAANLVFIPLAGKLGLYSKQETLQMEMIVEGICSIAKGENPTIVREKMQLFIAPKSRESAKAVA